MLKSHTDKVSVTYTHITKAKQLLKYQLKVKTGEGVKRFVEWYKAQTIAQRA
jgi:nucleoside-diphosphate-sugar epimerase